MAYHWINGSPSGPSHGPLLPFLLLAGKTPLNLSSCRLVPETFETHLAGTNSSFFRIPSTHHNFPTLHQFSMVIPYHFCWISLFLWQHHVRKTTAFSRNSLLCAEKAFSEGLGSGHGNVVSNLSISLGMFYIDGWIDG